MDAVSLPTLTYRTVTYCTDPRCTTTRRCWRAENEDFGNAPGENYGPRCVPAYRQRTYEQGIAEGERQATERIVAWLHEQVGAVTLHRVDDVSVDAASAGVAMLLTHLSNIIERGEHRREDGK